ncbi:MAG TPA: glycoside hydrolase, partial [Pseudonocardiaceae bacterium]
MRISKSSALAVGAASALLLGAISVVTGQSASAAGGSGGITVAYYDQWSIYQNAYYLKNLDTSGAANKLNYLI